MIFTGTQLQWTAQNSNILATITTPSPAIEEWTYIVGQFDANNLTLWINGQLVNTTTASFATVAAHSSDPGIGYAIAGDACDSTADNYYQGLMDEFVLHDGGVLNATEIMNNYRLKNGTYYWNVNASDGLEKSQSKTRQFTIYMQDPSSPNVTLDYPPQNYYNDISDPVNITFNCSATDNIELANISLYITNSTNESFSLNQTIVTTGISNSSSWQLSLNNGDYTWNCLAYDTVGNNDWGENRTIKINYTDTISPTWSNNKTNASSTTGTGETVYFNVTLTDNTAGSYYIFRFYNGTAWINETPAAWITSVELQEIRLINASRSQLIQWYWWFNDSAGNMNQTDVWNFTVANAVPTHTQPILNTTYGTNTTTENLTIYFQNISDIEGDNIYNITDWRVNGTSLAVLNLPFDAYNNRTKDFTTYDHTVVEHNFPINIDGSYRINTNDTGLNVSDSDAFDIRDRITIEAWVNITSHSNEDIIIARPWVSSGDPYIVYALGLADNNNFYLGITSGGSRTLCKSAIGSAQTDKLVHIVGTWDGTNMKVYVNGSQSGSSCLFAGQLDVNNEDIVIGHYPYESGTKNFNGTIDNIRLYNRSLSPEQISVNYHSGKAEYRMIVSNETAVGDSWQAAVTPADDEDLGITKLSNSLTITELVLNITSITILPDDDEFTPLSQINPVENSTLNVNLTANITNTTMIDNCLVRVYNSTDSYASPSKGPYIGIVSMFGSTTQCFANWTMEYYESVGEYNVSVDANLTNGEKDNKNTSYYYNELKAMNINVSSITFNASPGQTVNSSTAYPLGIENTGNSKLNISIKGTDFVGVTDQGYRIGVGNTTYNETGTGLFTKLSYNYTNITSMNNLIPTEIKSLFFRGYAPIGIISQEYKANISIKGE